MHYVLYRSTRAYGANLASGFLKYFTPRVDEARPVLAPMLASDPLAEGVREFASVEAAVDFLEATSAAVMTPRSDTAEDPFLGWAPMGVSDGDDRRTRLESEGLKEA